MPFYSALIIFVLFFLGQESTYANDNSPSIQSKNVSVQLTSEVCQVTQGVAFWVGFYFEIESSLKVHWQNPGESGLPVQVKWNLSHEFSSGKIC